MRVNDAVLVVAIAALVGACAVPSPLAWNDPFPRAEAPGAANDTEQELVNKRVVLQYYDAANNAKDFLAASKFVANNVEIHDPLLPDGLDGLQSYIQSLIKDHPRARVDVKRVLTAGDQVFLHSHAIRAPGSVGFIAGDIFRLENGKIVEQWSVLHPIPEKPHPDNPNGAF